MRRCSTSKLLYPLEYVLVFRPQVFQRFREVEQLTAIGAAGAVASGNLFCQGSEQGITQEGSVVFGSKSDQPFGVAAIGEV